MPQQRLLHQHSANEWWCSLLHKEDARISLVASLSWTTSSELKIIIIITDETNKSFSAVGVMRVCKELEETEYFVP